MWVLSGNLSWCCCLMYALWPRKYLTCLLIYLSIFYLLKKKKFDKGEKSWGSETGHQMCGSGAIAGSSSLDRNPTPPPQPKETWRRPHWWISIPPMQLTKMLISTLVLKQVLLLDYTFSRRSWRWTRINKKHNPPVFSWLHLCVHPECQSSLLPSCGSYWNCTSSSACLSTPPQKI